MKEEVKGDWKAWLAGNLAAWLIRLMALSLRIQLDDRVGYRKMGKPVLLALWHNRVLLPAYVWRRKVQHKQAVVLTSASRDGAILEAAMQSFGFGAVRGSSSRRGAAALVALRREARAGKDICITPDGPKGPKYVVKPGLVKLAQAAEMEVVVVRVDYHQCWRLKSWDGFQIPKPFSRVTISLNHRLEVEKKMDEAGFEKARAEIEAAMREGIHDIDL